jgi:hypothetical protein
MIELPYRRSPPLEGEDVCFLLLNRRQKVLSIWYRKGKKMTKKELIKVLEADDSDDDAEVHFAFPAGQKMRYLVVDNAFNRANYPTLIGQVFDSPPAYAAVRVVPSGGAKR